MSALEKFGSFGIVSRKREVEQVTATFKSLAVKAASIEAPVTSLSGGNQQKVVLARALLSEPRLIVADEPTQGVDVGARAEIYRILREITEFRHAGRRQFLRRGRARGPVRQGHRAVARARRRDADRRRRRGSQNRRGGGQRRASRRRLAEGAREAKARRRPAAGATSCRSDNAPAVPLAIVTVLLALYGYSQNANFLSSFNISNVLMLATALGFIALGQTIALLLAGVDLSVGPLAGLPGRDRLVLRQRRPAVVDDRGGLRPDVRGRTGRRRHQRLSHPVREFHADRRDARDVYRPAGRELPAARRPRRLHQRLRACRRSPAQVGPIPVAFLVLVALRHRAASTCCEIRGSAGSFARPVRTRNRRGGSACGSTASLSLGYVASSLFAALGAVMLMAQIGVGDPAPGRQLHAVEHHGGGARRHEPARRTRHVHRHAARRAAPDGSARTRSSFLGLSQTYQYVFQGALILIAALVSNT